LETSGFFVLKWWCPFRPKEPTLCVLNRPPLAHPAPPLLISAICLLSGQNKNLIFNFFVIVLRPNWRKAAAKIVERLGPTDHPGPLVRFYLLQRGGERAFFLLLEVRSLIAPDTTLFPRETSSLVFFFFLLVIFICVTAYSILQMIRSMLKLPCVVEFPICTYIFRIGYRRPTIDFFNNIFHSAAVVCASFCLT